MFAPHRAPFLAALALALLALAAPPAARADSLDAARAAGWVGERTDGFLGLVRQDAPPDVKRLVEEINAGRMAKYQEIARKNATTVVAVAALAGEKLIARTPSGQYYQGPDGAWVKRP